MNSKNRVPPGGLYGTQINLLTYLGDPVLKIALPNFPDFELKSNRHFTNSRESDCWR